MTGRRSGWYPPSSQRCCYRDRRWSMSRDSRCSPETRSQLVDSACAAGTLTHAAANATPNATAARPHTRAHSRGHSSQLNAATPNSTPPGSTRAHPARAARAESTYHPTTSPSSRIADGGSTNMAHALVENRGATRTNLTIPARRSAGPLAKPPPASRTLGAPVPVARPTGSDCCIGLVPAVLHKPSDEVIACVEALGLSEPASARFPEPARLRRPRFRITRKSR